MFVRERLAACADLFIVCLAAPLCFGCTAVIAEDSRGWMVLGGHLGVVWNRGGERKTVRQRGHGVENERAPILSSLDQFVFFIKHQKLCDAATDASVVISAHNVMQECTVKQSCRNLVELTNRFSLT